MDKDKFYQLIEQSENNITAKVIADSLNPDGCRLTTMEWTYPRFIHSEIMTHRAISRNAASSRAVPICKMIERVTKNPVFPIHWGKNKKGMQAEEELDLEQKLAAADIWISNRNDTIRYVKCLDSIGIHKQIGNRLLEPWMWITVVASATNFENLFALRCHKDAEPHFQNLAYKIRDVYDKSTPIRMNWNDWHLPYFSRNGGHEHDILEEMENWPKISAGRCARVSYLTQDGKRHPEEDIKLYERLVGSFPKHSSPLEHPAQAIEIGTRPTEMPISWNRRDWGNFDPGWLQLRKHIVGENITSRV